MYELIPRVNRFMPLLPEMDLFDRFFDDFRLPALFSEDGVVMPHFDVSESEKEYVITGEIPGMDVKDLDVTLLDGCLTVKGEKKQEKEEKEKNYHRIERHYGSFQRTFRIPDKVKADALEADYTDGVLKLTLPKVEPSEAKKIEVKAKKTRKKVKAKKS
jgi:HSP20 family protein